MSASELATKARSDLRVLYLQRRGRFTLAEPFFANGRRLPLARGDERQARAGELVLVRVEAGRARVVEVLGRPDCARDVVGALLVDRGLRRGFAEGVERQARSAATSPPDLPRRDLTQLATFTIDPSSARDFDDAVSLCPDGDALRTYVHIADVSAFVRPGTAVEGVARERGCSVYVPGDVEPMLPEGLSNDACSLVAGRPRAAVTVEMRIGAKGAVAGTRFYRSTIRSDRRLTYEEVDRVFAGRAPAPTPLGEPLAAARRLAGQLRRRRFERGALALETSEPEFDLDSDGQVVAAREVAQTEAHGLIEELMILANEQVAQYLESKRRGLLFRIHEQPEPQAIEFLVDQLESLDVPTPPVPERMTPRAAGALAAQISVKVREHVERTGRGRKALTALLLRSLQQAVYSPHNRGHAGLASPSYCHFTSPIRRYPDLVVHRALLDALGADGVTHSTRELEEAAWHCSLVEREAAQIERDADDICLAFLLERELFERGWETVFEGEVVGLIPAGAFVGFGLYEGFLPARRLRGEYYELNELGTALVGRRTGTTLRLGDPVSVTVERIERERGRVDLSPAPRPG